MLLLGTPKKKKNQARIGTPKKGTPSNTTPSRITPSRARPNTDTPPTIQLEKMMREKLKSGALDWFLENSPDVSTCTSKPQMVCDLLCSCPVYEQVTTKATKSFTCFTITSMLYKSVSLIYLYMSLFQTVLTFCIWPWLFLPIFEAAENSRSARRDM